MKRINYFLVILAFLAGSIITGSLIGVMTYANRSTSPGVSPPADKITDTQANGLFRGYFDTAHAFGDVIKGFRIERDVINALKLISTTNLDSYRLYFGSDHGLVAIIVGVDINDKDLINGGIYKVPLYKYGPCPPSCDKASPIIK